jgi:hypothetical protein
MSNEWQLAQVNVALPREPLDAPLLADFVAALDPINALADSSPGFVWRLKDDSGSATGISVFGDNRLIVNMSVWESLASLSDYVYRSAHADVMRDRKRWFHRLQSVFAALWWVPAGHRPNVAEAEERLRHLEQHGPSPFAFTFKAPYGPPDQPLAKPARVSDECPA